MVRQERSKPRPACSCGRAGWVAPPAGSYWYLQFMGVAPAWQGQGLGSALMAPVLARCDREGVRAYLDATSERNKRLYERHGFEAEEPFAPPGGPPLWPMWRQPASDR
jgi:GNAT superfamily N-acetyltransferase